MKVDKIIKNAKIFTSAAVNYHASAFAVKDGKFVYVGDEKGLKDYEGEVCNLGGAFVIPALIDSHVHVTMGVANDYKDFGPRIECTNKKECLAYISEYVRENPGAERYHFMLELAKLGGDILTKEDMDAVCPGSDIVIHEGEGHSVWVNSRVLDQLGVTDETPDISPNLSTYERDAEGHVTGNMFEGAEMSTMMYHTRYITKEQIGQSLRRWLDFCQKKGVTAVFDAGIPGSIAFHERCYAYLCEMDRRGELPVYIDGCYPIIDPRDAGDAVENVKRYNREFNTEHLKVHTLKIMMDGTLNIRTAAMVTPYCDTNTTGAALLNKEQIAELLLQLNEYGFNMHVHTVGEASSRIVLDGVELAKMQLGDKFRVKVTCAHLEIQDDADLERFAKLGVIANYTPWWHSGCCVSGGYGKALKILGKERADKMYRCKTLWDTGALVTWSSDNIAYGDFSMWSPYLGMEVGIRRIITEKTNLPYYYRNETDYPSACEKMDMEEMILGYTINGAKQLRIDDRKGSIEVGKDADFIVLNEDLLTGDTEGLSFIQPEEVFYKGKRRN